MRTAIAAAAALTFAFTAQADFSYKVSRKTGGAMAAMASAGPQTSTYYFKGQKMKSDNGSTATILDFDVQTITTINNTNKTYSVRSFGDLAASASDVQAQMEVKDTGQKKTINGFNASQVLITLSMDMPQLGKVPMEVEIWVSPDVPGATQVHEFYERNGPKFPWGAMVAGGNPGMQKAMADLQRKMMTLKGVPVEEIVRLQSPAGGAGSPAMPQLSAGQSAQLAQARARLEALANSGGPAAAMAKQQLEHMPGGAAPSAGGSTAMMEVTMDSTDFSSTPVDDSVFVIPAGYQKN